MNSLTKNSLATFSTLFIVLLTIMQSCKVGEDYQREEQNLPEEYRQETTIDSSIANVPWWELFKDPVLVDLINASLKENKNLSISLSRLEESYLYFDISKADFYPSVNYYTGASSGVNSESSSFSNSINAGVSVSYTIDLWKRVKTLNEAALQEYLASEEAYKAVSISIITAVASSYISLRDLDNRFIISEKTEKNYSDNLAVMQAKYDAGLVNEVDLTQSKIQLLEAKSTTESIIRARVQVENGISVLLGATPQDIPRGLPLQEQISLPDVPTGFPSELIERRPDILEAERKLHAQTLRIGAAEALQYPSLTLSLDMGTQLLDPTSLFADLGAQIFGPIFNGGKIKKGVEVEKVRTEQLLYNYQLTYLTALKEVEDAMIAQNTFSKEYDLRNEQVRLSTIAANLSWVRYDSGLTSYLEVLALQSSLFNSELKASVALQQELQSIINLYEALGGGWDPTASN